MANSISESNNDSGISVGMRVVVDGVTAVPELNGQSGVVLEYIAEKDRYNVKLDGDERDNLALKAKNLVPIVGETADDTESVLKTPANAKTTASEANTDCTKPLAGDNVAQEETFCDSTQEAENFDKFLASSIRMLSMLPKDEQQAFVDKSDKSAMSRVEAELTEAKGLVSVEDNLGASLIQLVGTSPSASSTASNIADQSGDGLIAARDIQKWEMVYEDKTLLKHSLDEKFDEVVCQQWFTSLTVDERKQVLRLKRWTSDEMKKSVMKHQREIEQQLIKDNKIEEVSQETFDLEKVLSPEQRLQIDAEHPEDPVVILNVLATIRTNSLRDDNYRVLYPVLSRLNHSCQANLWQINGNVYALRDIKKGEELCWCYAQGRILDGEKYFMFLDTAARRKHLMETYEFKCQCPCCSASKDDKENNKREMDRKMLLKFFEKMFVLMQKSGSKEGPGLTPEEWGKIDDIADTIEKKMTESNLEDMWMFSQISTIQAVYNSYRLPAVAEAERCGLDDDDIKEALDINEMAHLKALRNVVMTWGEECQASQLFQKRLANLFCGRQLRTYAKVINKNNDAKK